MLFKKILETNKWKYNTPKPMGYKERKFMAKTTSARTSNKQPNITLIETRKSKTH